jgi:hypothetical protein
MLTANVFVDNGKHKNLIVFYIFDFSIRVVINVFTYAFVLFIK